jgi:hypothetical protein
MVWPNTHITLAHIRMIILPSAPLTQQLDCTAERLHSPLSTYNILLLALIESASLVVGLEASETLASKHL